MLRHLQKRGCGQFQHGRAAVLKLAVVFLLALALPAAMFAATFSISFEQNPITMGDSVTMSMNFDAQPTALLSPLPSVPGLSFQNAGQGMTAINGVATYFYKLNVTPAHPGDFVIPSMKATVGGQTCESQPVTLKVVKPGAAAPNNDIAFTRLELPKPSVYVGEVFNVELNLYLREGIVGYRDIQVNPPQAQGLTILKTRQLNDRQTRLGNTRYLVVPVELTLSAAKVGKLTIDPTELDVSVFYGPLNIFGQPTRGQRIALTNQPAAIQSLPLPIENVPPCFSGAIGNYEMNLSVSPTNVAMGDPLTVKVDIAGRGTLDGLRLPTQTGWEHHFKIYPPTSQFEPNPNDPLTGTMHFALTAVPETMDVKELPPFIFTYFNPDTKSYQTLTHPAVPLIVRPSAASLPAPVAGGNASDNPVPPQDVSPIKPRLGTLAQLSPPLVRQTWFLMLQGIPALAWVSLLIRRKQREALANNPRLRRRKEVEKTVHAGIKELHDSANSGDSEKFYATMFHLLQEQLGERLDVPSSAITEAVLDERLRPLGVDESQLAELRKLFQACNQARYARTATNEELVSLIPRVESALNELRKVNA